MNGEKLLELWPEMEVCDNALWYDPRTKLSVRGTPIIRFDLSESEKYKVNDEPEKKKVKQMFFI